MMSKKLFNEFKSVSSKEWKQKIQVDLKGADYNNTLIWQTIEGIDVKPFYHADEFIKDINTISMPKKWSICQTIFVHNTTLSNKKIIDAIARGAESIKLIIQNSEVSIENLLQNIDLDVTPLYFEMQFLDSEYLKKITKLKSKTGPYISIDIIGNLCKSGNWYSNLKEDHVHFNSIVQNAQTFSIDVSLYQNAGATMVQQLAYALSQANEYLNHFKDTTVNLNEIIFNISIGSNYFFEIAKIRALRLLFNTLISQYNIKANCHIIATPTKRNKTIYDYNTNMLRTTTECMSAILGGADSISNLAYDGIYHKDNEFGERIARNQLLVLKHESYFDLVNNIAEGSYYVESITNQLAEKALDLFKDIESHGGFLSQLKDGTIQRKIKESADKEQEQFDKGELVLLGTNKYSNAEDRMKHELELFPFIKTNIRKTWIKPIIERRLSEQIEQERLKTEN